MEVRFRFHNEWFPVHWECFSIDAQDMGSRYMSSTEDAVLEIPSPLGVIEKRLSEFLTEKRTTVFEARIPDYFDENTN